MSNEYPAGINMGTVIRQQIYDPSSDGYKASTEN